MDQTVNIIIITNEGIQDVISNVSSQEQPEADNELPCSDTEKLFIYRPVEPQPAGAWSLHVALQLQVYWLLRLCWTNGR